MADSEAPKQKRKLRAPASTVREVAAKAQDDSVKPSKRRRVRRQLSWPFRAVAWIGHKPPLRQISHGFRWFFRLRVMRFLGKILGLRYLARSFSELKLVTWPTRKQSRQLTTAVILFSIIFGAFIAVVDFGLDKLFKTVILK